MGRRGRVVLVIHYHAICSCYRRNSCCLLLLARHNGTNKTGPDIRWMEQDVVIAIAICIAAITALSARSPIADFWTTMAVSLVVAALIFLPRNYIGYIGYIQEGFTYVEEPWNRLIEMPAYAMDTLGKSLEELKTTIAKTMSGSMSPDDGKAASTMATIDATEFKCSKKEALCAGSKRVDDQLLKEYLQNLAKIKNLFSGMDKALLDKLLLSGRKSP